MKLSIIILNFNTKDLLANCIDSILKNLKGDYEIIVVDNASYDGTVAMLKFRYKKVRVVENEKNYGFAKGVNAGAKHAKGDVLLFLNSDTKMPKENGVFEAIQQLEKENTGIIGGRMLNEDHTIQRSFGSFYSPLRVFLMLLGGDKAELALQKGGQEQKVDWVSGGFMLVKRSVFENLGGFDEHFFMYIEDMELCYRARKNGHNVLFNPLMQVEHLGQGSSNRSFAIINIYKNLLYFYSKHRSRLEFYMVKSMLVVKAVLVIIFATILWKKDLAKTYKQAMRFS